MSRHDSEALLHSVAHGSRDLSDEEDSAPSESEEEGEPAKSHNRKSSSSKRTLLLVGIGVVVLGALCGIGYILYTKLGPSASSSNSSGSAAGTAGPSHTSATTAASSAHSSATTSKTPGASELSSGGASAAESAPDLSRTAPGAASASENAAGGSGSETASAPTATSTEGSTSPTVGGSGAGLAASLAAQYSMAPASMASLPFPNSAMESSDTIDYMRDSWGMIKGDSDFITFVADPFDSSSSSSVVAVEYPEGSYAGNGPAGGFMGGIMSVFGEDAGIQRALLSYEVSFSPDFDWVAGGKLPGLFGGNHEDGCAGGQQTYVPRYNGFCTDKDECNETYVISLNRGAWKFTAGEWQTITELVILNSDPGTPGVANGILQLYFGDDSMPVISREDVVFRTSSDVTFTALFFSTFFGGSSAKFASEGGTAYFRNFQFYAGADASSGDGAQVSAEVPS